eukprot:927258-Amphidinium_carterae.1
MDQLLGSFCKDIGNTPVLMKATLSSLYGLCVVGCQCKLLSRSLQRQARFHEFNPMDIHVSCIFRCVSGP